MKAQRACHGAAILIALISACSGPTSEERARAVAADIEASIQDFDTAALAQEIDPKIVREIQTQLTELKDFMGEIDGEIDPVLINAIQAFQRRENEKIAWWRIFSRKPNDGLITEDLRAALAKAAG